MRERSEHSLSNTKSSIAADTHAVKFRAWTLGTGPRRLSELRCFPLTRYTRWLSKWDAVVTSTAMRSKPMLEECLGVH
jgi:hypothetical protein